MTKNGLIVGRDGEGNLGECGVEGFNTDNRRTVLWCTQTKNTQESINLEIWIRRPDTNVVPMLICYA
jgi:hypothetical protein